MADVNTTKIVSLERLGTYDGLIKKYITDADAVVNAKSIKTVLLDGDNIKFYKKENATVADTADYTVAISSSDVTSLKTRVGLGVDLNTYQTKTNLTEIVNVLTGADTTEGSVAKAVKDLADGQVKTNADAIDAINNETTGILAQAKSYTDTLANGQVATNKSAIEAINDTTTGILANAKKYTDDEIAKLDATVTNVSTEEGATAPDVQVTVVETDGKLTSVSATVTAERFDSYGAASAVQGNTTETVASVDTKVGTINTTLGDMSAVKTTAKTVAGAVDELKDAVDTAKSAGQVYLDTASTPSEGYLKTYVISQGKNAEGEKIEIGKIDIPKDLVVTAGEVVVIDDEHATTELPAGTYIKLTIANQETPIYINVKDLVDVYTAAKDATQVQLAISDANEISATIVAGSVGTTELTDAGVTTVKIADKNVTLGKLADDVQTSLGKADSAVQSVTTGATDGTVAVDGTDVAVKGLASAAYVTVDSLNTTAEGYATTAETNAKAYADSLYSVATIDEINALFDTSNEDE